MKILKYLLLLFFLFLIGLTVFVTTQKGEYDIVRSEIISKSKSIVYTYVSDYRNWETFGTWTEEYPNLKINYPSKTSGKGAFISWKSTDDNGYAKTVSSKENDSIAQKVVWNDMNSNLYWTLKDTLGKTKVSIRTKGQMDLKTKIFAFFNGGINSILGNIIEKNLKSLNHTLNFELDSYKVKVNGIVQLPKRFYISQSINSYDDKVLKNIKVMIPNLQHFFDKNKMTSIGKPFVLYNNQDSQAKTTNLSICLAVRDSVFMSEGSDMGSGKLEAMSAVKVTLTGDYSHLNVAKRKALEYLNKNQLRQDLSLKTFEVYVKTVQDVKNPSQWITEVYYPIVPKRVVIEHHYTLHDSIQ